MMVSLLLFALCKAATLRIVDIERGYQREVQ